MIKEGDKFVIYHKYKNFVLFCLMLLCFYIFFTVMYTHTVLQYSQDFRALFLEIILLAGCALFFSFATAPFLILRNFNKYKVLEICENGFEVPFLGFISWNEVLKIEIGHIGSYPKPCILVQPSRIFKIPKKMNLKDSALYYLYKPIDVYNNIIIINLHFFTDANVNEVYDLMRKYYNNYHGVADMSEFRKSE